MKRIIAFAFLSIFIFNTQKSEAQNFEALLTAEKPVECADIAYNAGKYFEQYWIENKTEALADLLIYWEEKCGLREPVFRAKILFAIAQNKFNDSLLTAASSDMFTNYENRLNYQKQSKYYLYDDYKSYFGYTPFGQSFDKFSKKIADSLLLVLPDNSTAYTLAKLYAGEAKAINTALYQKIDAQSGMAVDYDKKLKEYKNETGFHYAIMGGLWMPTGDLKPLGLHPELGFMLGGKNKKLNFDLVLGVKFVNAPNQYYFTRKWDAGKPIDSGNYFSGWHAGIDFSYDLIQKEKHEVQVIAGIAYDGFNVEPSANNNNNNRNTRNFSLEASSYNFSFGAGYRFYLTQTSYLGIRAKYNLVDYRLSHVIDFTGNPFTIQVVYGGLSFMYRNNVNKMGYKSRL